MIAVTAAVAGVTGVYYRRRIDGVPGDCLGATNQIAEVAVYLTGAITPGWFRPSLMGSHDRRRRDKGATDKACRVVVRKLGLKSLLG